MRYFNQRFYFIKQTDKMDCAAACIKMVSKYYGKDLNLTKLKDLCEVNRAGTTLLGLCTAAEKIGFETTSLKLSHDELLKLPMPLILHWDRNHYVVLVEIKHSYRNTKYVLADPDIGKVTVTQIEFLSSWIPKGTGSKGIAVHLSPTSTFKELKNDIQRKYSLSSILGYLAPYKRLLVQLFIGLMATTVLQVVFPIFTQLIVDVGIKSRDISFVQIILFAQIALMLGRMVFEFLRSWLLMYISVRLNIHILTEFLFKLMRLPISFFETKMTGDILQRMNDQKRIEQFLTGSGLNILFSFFSLIMLSGVLLGYNIVIFIVFAIGTVLYVFWIFSFLGRRKKIDEERFVVAGKSQSQAIQMINGMQDIKLNNSETKKRWEWERHQVALFDVSIKGLILNQRQQIGSFILNEGKNILITFLCAKSVINGQLSLGSLVAIQYLVGQLNGPVNQFLTFIQNFQDARISFERIGELQSMPNEDDLLLENAKPIENKVSSIRFENVSFSYPGIGNVSVLEHLFLTFPAGKTTAIVGASGSGKTTILKLILRYYQIREGNIYIGSQNLSAIEHESWRSACAIVMQEGYIFSDTIEDNICMGLDIDPERLRLVIRVANLEEFIDQLPQGLRTIVGVEGNGISQGQKQRILIARAVYKNPAFIFMDEGTNALDANNERQIMENLDSIFKDKTVIIVAHRLSTIINADKIVLLDKGRVVKSGTHAELLNGCIEYSTFFNNQLLKNANSN